MKQLLTTILLFVTPAAFAHETLTTSLLHHPWHHHFEQGEYLLIVSVLAVFGIGTYIMKKCVNKSRRND